MHSLYWQSFGTVLWMWCIRALITTKILYSIVFIGVHFPCCNVQVIIFVFQHHQTPMKALSHECMNGDIVSQMFHSSSIQYGQGLCCFMAQMHPDIKYLASNGATLDWMKSMQKVNFLQNVGEAFSAPIHALQNSFIECIFIWKCNDGESFLSTLQEKSSHLRRFWR